MVVMETGKVEQAAFPASRPRRVNILYLRAIQKYLNKNMVMHFQGSGEIEPGTFKNRLPKLAEKPICEDQSQKNFKLLSL
jgi:hypothetical protein